MSDNLIPEIKNRVDIVEIISESVSLKKTGKHYKGLCPFHQEKTPSFIVNPEKQIFYCFGCQKGGDVFKFLQEKTQLPFKEILAQLASRCGLELKEYSSEKQALRDKYFSCHRVVAWFYHEQLLKSEEAQAARLYLKDRKVSAESIEKFRLGYSSGNSSQLIRFLEKHSIALNDAIQSGLIKEGQKGYYESFRERLIFPIFNREAKVAGLGGRLLKEKEQAPKYLNSAESVIYDKKSLLFGLNFAKESMAKQKRVFLVEGYLDVIAMHQAGIAETVAPLGTAFTEEQLKLLKPYAEEFYILFDEDEAGWKAKIKALELCLNQEILPKTILFNPGDDPDSFLKREGKEAFHQKILKETRNLFEVLIDKCLAGPFKSLEESRKALAYLKPFLEKVKSPLLIRHFIQRMSSLLQIESDWILEELAIPLKHSLATKNLNQKTKTSKIDLESLVLKIYIQELKFRNLIKTQVQPEDFREEASQKIASYLWQKEEEQDFGRLLEDFPEPELKAKFNLWVLEQMSEEKETLNKILLDALAKLKENNFKEQLKEISGQIFQLQNENNSEKLMELLGKKQNLLARNAKKE